MTTVEEAKAEADRRALASMSGFGDWAKHAPLREVLERIHAQVDTEPRFLTYRELATRVLIEKALEKLPADE